MGNATACARVIVEELISRGVRDVVLAPGARSAPLAYECFEADRIGLLRLHVRVDERTAGFLALGLAKGYDAPAAVLTTSGTATANLHPAVLEAAVIAAPDERWGEVPVAIVVFKEGQQASEAELIEFCRERLAHFKCPKAISVIEALPRTATGKIQKNQLRDRFWKGQAKKVN